MNTFEESDRQPTLVIDSLSVAYRSKMKMLSVLRDVSFSISHGESYGLVGESGCGKSTIAMAVMSYLASNGVIESGSIAILGEDVVTATPKELREWRGSRMAMVYQDPGSSLNPSMRVGRQVAEVYHYHAGCTWDDAMDKTRHMFEQVRFSDPGRILQRYPHELSGGQQQRVMIAMALATNPALLIMDEPTTGLDATVEADILDLVTQLRSNLGTSILFISHNLGVVARICDRVGVLYAGRLVEEGDTSEVLRAPRHPYTIGLLNSIPKWGVTKRASRLVPIPGDLPPLGQVLPGCAFATRCEIGTPECTVAVPPLEPCEGSSIRSACLRRDNLGPLLERVIAQEAVPASINGTRPHGAKSVVTVDHLVKRFRSDQGDITVLSDVSLTIESGEILGLVGESGSGKTTLARTIAGLYKPDGGEIVSEGETQSSRHSRANYLQMVFQNPDTALNPSHTIARILGRAIKRLGTPHSATLRAQRVVELAQSVKLQGHHLQLRPGALSGGLKQRVAIGRAFAGEPSVVVLDEPASALDVSVQAAILNLLVDLQRERDISYLFISHDLAVINYLADRIAVMYLGEIIEMGPASTVISPPNHPYTEVLLSANSAVNSTSGQRIRLKGQLPSLVSPPSGCRFHTRCPRYLGDLCRDEIPPLQSVFDGHTYRCHIAPNELEEKQRLQSIRVNEVPVPGQAS